MVGTLLHALAERNPRLRGDAWALLPPDRCVWLANHAEIVDTTPELQMMIEPGQVAEGDAAVAVRRLTSQDLPAMEGLARTTNLGVWHGARSRLARRSAAIWTPRWCRWRALIL